MISFVDTTFHLSSGDRLPIPASPDRPKIVQAGKGSIVLSDVEGNRTASLATGESVELITDHTVKAGSGGAFVLLGA